MAGPWGTETKPDIKATVTQIKVDLMKPSLTSILHNMLVYGVYLAALYFVVIPFVLTLPVYAQIIPLAILAFSIINVSLRLLLSWLIMIPAFRKWVLSVNAK